MKIDGKENVKERIKVFEGDSFITYLYIFENGNSFNDTVDKWHQTSTEGLKKCNADERLRRHYWEMGL